MSEGKEEVRRSEAVASSADKASYMKTIKSIPLMQHISRKLRCSGKSIGFVPTMGALHAGHASLIYKARQDNDIVIVSIFVNPMQFGPHEDLKRYPRPFLRDAALCRKLNVDYIFCPEVQHVYPSGFATAVEVRRLQDVLCGSIRPGHFRGVATVVAKLFNACMPDRAYFGRKDAQQAVIIRRMVADLNIPVEVKVMPIVREPDGLAMSSRNVYLNPQERKDAVVLFKALQQAKNMISQGKRNAHAVKKAMHALILSKKTASIDYIAIVDADTLTPLDKIKGKCLIALAVRIGRTRLIDNIVVN